jgi:peptidase M48-like protein
MTYKSIQWRLMLTGTILVLPSSLIPQSPPPPPNLSVEYVADRVSQNEAALKAKIRELHPIIEVYIQGVLADPKLGAVPNGDAYFLGRFDWDEREGPKLRSLTSKNSSTGNWLSRTFTTQYLPDGFAAMGAPDWFALDRQRYDFTFVRREFLGEARCLVFDVQPRGGSRDGFSGRIWVEDRDYHVVRFNGINRDRAILKGARKRIPFHVDTWRANVAPGVWLPSYVYSEEVEENDPQAIPRIKSQVRFWGYDPMSVSTSQEFTAIRIDERTVRDEADRQQLSPVQGQRLWEQQAEENVIDRLSRAGLLAPPNSVDKVVETVLRNLEITNDVALEQELSVRTLLTSPLESLTVGHTIVLSRGLIDVLPDEASLAMMLAHELAHVVLGHQLIDTKFAYADRLMVPDNELLRVVRFPHDASVEAAADEKAIELLKNSPYKDKLAEGGLFLRAVAANTRKLPNLIQPHLGEQLADDRQLQRLSELMQQAPALAPESLDQVAALPLGARVIVDPWSGQLELLRSAVAPTKAREKVPLAIAPLVPFIRYAPAQTSAQSSQ